MAECHETPTRYLLPVIDDATLADMSGPEGLTQAELWDGVGSTEMSRLGAWALGEAARFEAEGVSVRDAFLAGVGYAVQAIAKQQRRNADKETVTRLLATVSVEEEV